MTSNYNAMVINTTNTMLGEFTTIGFIIASPICVAPNTCEYISCGDNWVCNIIWDKIITFVKLIKILWFHAMLGSMFKFAPIYITFLNFYSCPQHHSFWWQVRHLHNWWHFNVIWYNVIHFSCGCHWLSCLKIGHVHHLGSVLVHPIPTWTIINQTQLRA